MSRLIFQKCFHVCASACRCDALLTVRFGQPRQAVVLLMCDEVGEASEQTATQLTLEDGVHLPQQHVLQLAGACEPRGGAGEEGCVSAAPGTTLRTFVILKTQNGLLSSDV